MLDEKLQNRPEIEDLEAKRILTPQGNSVTPFFLSLNTLALRASHHCWIMSGFLAQSRQT
jgi:hypothetical protein